MNWYAFIKKYVWDDEKTPYLVPAERLSRTQARNELFTFSVLLAVFCMVIAIAALLGRAFQGQSTGVAVFSFTVFCAASVLATTRHHIAALYCSAAPPVAIVYFFLYGFPPNLHMIDELLMLAAFVVMLRYTFRVVAIAKAYPYMPADDRRE